MSEQPTAPPRRHDRIDPEAADGQGQARPLTNPLGQPDQTKQKLLDAANAARKPA